MSGPPIGTRVVDDNDVVDDTPKPLSGGQTMDVPVAAIAPLVLLALAFVGYCLIDIRRSEVRHLPRWVWALICVFSVPLGGIIYLLVGREPASGR